MSKKFDLHARRAQIHEAAGAPVHVVLDVVDGEEVTVSIPAMKVWRQSAQDAIGRGDMSEWARLTMSEGDYAKWKDADLSIGEVEAVFDYVAEAHGVDPTDGDSSPTS